MSDPLKNIVKELTAIAR